MDLLNHHAQFAQLDHFVNFTTLSQVVRPLNKQRVQLVSTVPTLVLTQVPPVYQVTFKRQPDSKAAPFALQDFTVHLVECRLQLLVLNSSFAKQVAYHQYSAQMDTYANLQLRLLKQRPLFVQRVNSAFKVSQQLVMKATFVFQAQVLQPPTMELKVTYAQLAIIAQREHQHQLLVL